jgi:hypothetical protein
MPLGWRGVKKIVDSRSLVLLLFAKTDRMPPKRGSIGRESS